MTPASTRWGGRGPAPHGRRAPRGFSLLEMLVVLVILGTLARIALPHYEVVRRKARAADVIGNFEVVRVAAFNYNGDYHAWPADTEAGEVPPELESYLPEGFTFEYRDYTLDWERWMLPDGLPMHPETKVLIGISMVTTDEAFGNEVLNLLGRGSAAYTVGDHYTQIFVGM